MTTTQSKDPNERVDHPRHYNAHSSGIETIELIEHLPCNLANAVKYIWRCGLKATETPLRDMKSAKWYTEREAHRWELFEIAAGEPPRTEIVWRAHAHRVIEADFGSTLAEYLNGLLRYDFDAMISVVDGAIAGMPQPVFSKLPSPLEAAVSARDALWMLLDNIDTLDDSCRDNDLAFRDAARREQKKRFHIYDPDKKESSTDAT